MNIIPVFGVDWAFSTEVILHDRVSGEWMALIRCFSEDVPASRSHNENVILINLHSTSNRIKVIIWNADVIVNSYLSIQFNIWHKIEIRHIATANGIRLYSSLRAKAYNFVYLENIEKYFIPQACIQNLEGSAHPNFITQWLLAARN